MLWVGVPQGGGMDRIVILATEHWYQCQGHFLNSKFEKRLCYLAKRFNPQIVLEEWSEKEPQSFAARFAATEKLSRKNVGTPDEAQFRTYKHPVNYPGHDGTLKADEDAPSLSEYGPIEVRRIGNGDWSRTFRTK